MADELNGKLAMVGHPPAVHIVKTETQRVGCPYCAERNLGLVNPGYVDVTAEISPGPEGRPVMQIRDFHTPKKCVTCNRFFKLEPILQVRGVPIQGE